MASKTKTGRSAVTGRFVTIPYATKHPKTTIIETVKTGKKGTSKK